MIMEKGTIETINPTVSTMYLLIFLIYLRLPMFGLARRPVSDQLWLGLENV